MEKRILSGSSIATLKLPKGNLLKAKPLSVRGRIPSAPASVKALRSLGRNSYGEFYPYGGYTTPEGNIIDSWS
jgi:hypothetical protein